MACPFCALGCREGRPTLAEVYSQRRHLQKFAHPDHPGGNSELSVYTNLSKDLALKIVSEKIVTKCPKHMAEPAAVTSSSSTTRFGTPARQSQPQQQQQTPPDHRPPVFGASQSQPPQQQQTQSQFPKQQVPHGWYTVFFQCCWCSSQTNFEGHGGPCTQLTACGYPFYINLNIHGPCNLLWSAHEACNREHSLAADEQMRGLI